MVIYCIEQGKKQLLLLGLTAANLQHVLMGGTLMLSEATHAVMPPELTIAIMSDETAEATIQKELDHHTLVPVMEPNSNN